MDKNTQEKINIAIESELKREFNIKCIENGTNMSKVLKSFIKEYVNTPKLDLDEETMNIVYDSFKD